jgi:hypothetical protein
VAGMSLHVESAQAVRSRCPPRRGSNPCAGDAVFLDDLAQPVRAQRALLLDRLDRDEAHRGPPVGLADRHGVVGVVLVDAALAAARADELGPDEPLAEVETHDPARPVVRASTGLDRNDAPRGQLHAPVDELGRALFHRESASTIPKAAAYRFPHVDQCLPNSIR